VGSGFGTALALAGACPLEAGIQLEEPMTKTLVLALVLAGFGAVTANALAVHGYVGLLETLLSTPAGIQVMLDLVIAETLVLIWMSRDAKERGLPFWRYAIATLFLGSFGPLAYLIHREVRERTVREVPA
jgi:hypothetical protein